jgi:hypothetical protein
MCSAPLPVHYIHFLFFGFSVFMFISASHTFYQFLYRKCKGISRLFSSSFEVSDQFRSSARGLLLSYGSEYTTSLHSDLVLSPFLLYRIWWEEYHSHAIGVVIFLDLLAYFHFNKKQCRPISPCCRLSVWLQLDILTNSSIFMDFNINFSTGGHQNIVRLLFNFLQFSIKTRRVYELVR